MVLKIPKWYVFNTLVLHRFNTLVFKILGQKHIATNFVRWRFFKSIQWSDRLFWFFVFFFLIKIVRFIFIDCVLAQICARSTTQIMCISRLSLSQSLSYISKNRMQFQILFLFNINFILSYKISYQVDFYNMFRIYSLPTLFCWIFRLFIANL